MDGRIQCRDSCSCTSARESAGGSTGRKRGRATTWTCRRGAPTGGAGRTARSGSRSEGHRGTGGCARRGISPGGSHGPIAKATSTALTSPDWHRARVAARGSQGVLDIRLAAPIQDKVARHPVGRGKLLGVPKTTQGRHRPFGLASAHRGGPASRRPRSAHSTRHLTVAG